MSLQGYKALVKEESSLIPFTDEATTTADDKNYQITDSSKRIWGFNSTIVVKDAGVPTIEAYTLSRLDGKVAFDTVDAGRVITVTGDHVVLTAVATAKEWKIDLSADMLDTTVFQKSAREYTPGLTSGTADIGKFYDIDNYYIDMLFNGTTKVIELYAAITGDPIRVYANVSSDSIATPVEALIEESISLQITNKMVLEA